eukprot:1158171-Pelagomonas_calceolata.AAC.4
MTSRMYGCMCLVQRMARRLEELQAQVTEKDMHMAQLEGQLQQVCLGGWGGAEKGGGVSSWVG